MYHGEITIEKDKVAPSARGSSSDLDIFSVQYFQYMV